MAQRPLNETICTRASHGRIRRFGLSGMAPRFLPRGTLMAITCGFAENVIARSATLYGAARQARTIVEAKFAR
eukprot:12937884-Prorocentrum_lima.AAC.1